MSIHEYSLSRDSTRQLSPSFRVREFGCKGSDVVLLDEELVVLLQCIREHFGKPVHITSGYRTAAHNAAVGGSKSSQHLLGRAADFYVEGVDVATVAAYAETLLPIDSTQLEQLISTGFTTVSALVNWWFNNSFTQAALAGDEEYERRKKQVQ